MIAKALKVRSITTDANLDRLGQTFWNRGTPEIVLQGGQSAARRRFTLAHELAHTVLGHGFSSETNRSVDGPARPNFRREEWQADAVAGCLVVPDHAVQRLRDLREAPDDRVATLADIRGIADAYGVSNSVVVRRLSEFDRTRHWLLLNFRRHHRGSWLMWRIIGRLRGIDAPMRVLDSNFLAFDRLPERDVRMKVLARFDDHIFELTGTGNRRRDLVLVLVHHARLMEDSHSAHW